MTSVAWLHSLDFLGESTILGHAVFTDEHPWMNWPTREDIELLATTGTTVAHCPTVFARDGTLMHHLGAYMDAGVNIAIGTDTHPQNMLEEIRLAETLARVAAGTRHSTSTSRLFHAATIGAAKLLGRDDIGRLAEGAKADIVLFDLGRPEMQPMRDPLRAIVHSAAERALTDVFVDGHQVVGEGRVLTIDWPQAARALAAEQKRIGDGAADLDAAAPLSLSML